MRLWNNPIRGRDDVNKVASGNTSITQLQLSQYACVLKKRDERKISFHVRKGSARL